MAESVIAFPRCVDTHRTAEQPALTSLQGVIYRVLDDDRIGSFGLRCVPVGFSFI
jgi:hypothetical protein